MPINQYPLEGAIAPSGSGKEYDQNLHIPAKNSVVFVGFDYDKSVLSVLDCRYRNVVRHLNTHFKDNFKHII